jgi:hypothetical protein
MIPTGALPLTSSEALAEDSDLFSWQKCQGDRVKVSSSQR